MNVESRAAEKLGEVDGFIMDLPSARPLYVVVDAGGWFTSRFFLLPVGHAGLDTERRKLIADLSRDNVKKFPGFDLDEFEKLSDEELNRMDERMVAACCPNEAIDRSASAQRYDRWSHYRQPSWWDASYYRPDRADNAARSMASTGTAASSGVTMPSRDAVRAERDREREQEREAVIAREEPAGSASARPASPGDVSPHFGGRAQPGDVLGLETGGEETHIGDTTDDENKRREDAEKAAGKNPPRGDRKR